MPLTKDQIQALLAQPAKRGGGRGKGGKTIDVSVRDYATWFKLAHHIFDEETQELAKCENPNCEDPRPETQGKVVAKVNGSFMCRFCFLGGWLLINPDQETLTDEASK